MQQETLERFPEWTEHDLTQRKQWWYNGIMMVSVSDLTLVCKAIMYVLYDWFRTKECDDERFVVAFYGTGVHGEGLTGLTGLSLFQVSRAVDELVDVGILRRRRFRNEKDRNRVALAPTPLFYDPANCKLRVKRKGGGWHPVRCESCGGKVFDVNKTCCNCGEVTPVMPGQFEYRDNGELRYLPEPIHSYTRFDE